MTFAGIRPEQGPPLSVPVSFFLTAPLALAAAGVLLLARGADGLASLSGSTAVALVHLGTVGMLLFVMLGALYQVLPVVVGAVVPWIRAAHVVHLALLVGFTSLVYAQARVDGRAFGLAAVLVSSAVALFLVPAGIAVARSEVESATARGIALALVGLLAVVVAGVRLASVRAGLAVTDDWQALRAAHAHVGFLGWVGALVTSVSWQVLPMFYFAAPPPGVVSRVTSIGIATSLILLAVALFVTVPVPVALLALPGALAVWLVHPLWALASLRKRKRRRPDATLSFWWLGLGVAPACLLLGAQTAWGDDPRGPLLYGLFVLWGWAGAIAHGMLMRIVPFLAWLHWCAPRLGQAAHVPSAKELLPDREVQVGLALHVLTLALGAAAIVTGHALAWQALGVGLLATAAALLRSMLAALYRASREVAPPAGARA